MIDPFVFIYSSKPLGTNFLREITFTQHPLQQHKDLASFVRIEVRGRGRIQLHYSTFANQTVFTYDYEWEQEGGEKKESNITLAIYSTAGLCLLPQVRNKKVRGRIKAIKLSVYSSDDVYPRRKVRKRRRQKEINRTLGIHFKNRGLQKINLESSKSLQLRHILVLCGLF